ncbi:hypothetical protein VNO77_04040 [Canavalia gladiata]|uniref:Uncharacterized protein n=1 Tax=Canavalia gladiata TaxID=3824 RepID=A0AAN9N1I1_CANGL
MNVDGGWKQGEGALGLKSLGMWLDLTSTREGTRPCEAARGKPNFARGVQRRTICETRDEVGWAGLGSHGPFVQICLFLGSFIALAHLLIRCHHHLLRQLSSMRCKDMAKVKVERSERRRRRKEERVERKMKKLQRLVPGGSRMKPDRLFLNTAKHILHLRLQLNVLQALTKIFNA